MEPQGRVALEGSSEDLMYTVVPSRARDIVYIILPVEPSLSLCRVLANRANKHHRYAFCLVWGSDWTRFMNPWPAKRVFSNTGDFTGEGEKLLDALSQRLCPEVERGLDPQIQFRRHLCGISLSGLMALWISLKSGMFESALCISASLWYDGLEEWLHEQQIPCGLKNLYLQIGNLESDSRSERICHVYEATERIWKWAQERGLRTKFHVIEGNHFSPVIPRIEKAVSFLYEEPLGM